MANFHFHQRLILISDGRPTDFTIISADDTPVMETDEVSIGVLFLAFTSIVSLIFSICGLG